MHPRPRRGAVGCEKTAVRQVGRARRPTVQPCCGDDMGCHVGAGFGRRPSIGRRFSAIDHRGIAISASWNVTYRPCRADCGLARPALPIRTRSWPGTCRLRLSSTLRKGTPLDSAPDAPRSGRYGGRNGSRPPGHRAAPCTCRRWSSRRSSNCPRRRAARPSTPAAKRAGPSIRKPTRSLLMCGDGRAPSQCRGAREAEGDRAAVVDHAAVKRSTAINSIRPRACQRS